MVTGESPPNEITDSDLTINGSGYRWTPPHGFRARGDLDMLHHRALSLCIGLAMIGIGHAQAPAPAASPQATSPEPKPGPTAGALAGSLRLTLRAALVDKDLNVKPVPRFALRIYRTEEPGLGTEIRTTLGGTAEVDLPAGN